MEKASDLWTIQGGSLALSLNGEQLKAIKKEIRRRGIKAPTEDDIYEICVLCHKQTQVLISEHIENRAYYVEGSGQLCHECHDDVYGT